VLLSSVERSARRARSMGDVRSSEDDYLSDDVEAPSAGSSYHALCRASYFPIIRMCSRHRSDQTSPGGTTSSPPEPPHSDDTAGTMTADDGLATIERRAVRDRNGRILFYYAPLPHRRGLPVNPSSDGQAVACRVSMCKSRSAGEILSTSSPVAAVNKSRFAVPLQVRRRQLDDIRRRLAAVDVDDDDRQRDSSSCEVESDTSWQQPSPEERISERRLTFDDDDGDEVDKHRKQRRQRLQQAVTLLTSFNAGGPAVVRRGGSVESDSGSRSDRDCSTDGSASGSTDTDHDQTSLTVSYTNN